MISFLTFQGAISKNRVKVFDQPSRNDSMIISLKKSDLSNRTTEVLAQTFIGQTIYVGWPHLSEAKVIKISDSCNVYTRNMINGLVTSVNNERWKTDVRAIQEQ